MRFKFICLNPCCSGRWSRTFKTLKLWQHYQLVLILVVVEDGLVPHLRKTTEKKANVLILVVVEDGLVL